MRRIIKITKNQLEELRIKFQEDVNLIADGFENTAGTDAETKFHPSDYYIGITDDLERRMREHHADDGYYFACKNRRTACAVEEELFKRGFDAGKRPANGGTVESTIVYLYRKIPGVTIEDTNQ